MVFDIIVLLVGVVVGWAVPQPDFVKQLFDMVKERLKARRPQPIPSQQIQKPSEYRKPPNWGLFL